MEELPKQVPATVKVKFGTEAYHTPIQEPDKRRSVRDEIAERFKLEAESIEASFGGVGDVAFKRDKEIGRFKAGTELAIKGKPGK